jgi:transposase
MLTQEEDMEIAALRGRGWSVSAIARHTGRDRKTIRTYLAGQAKIRGHAASVLEPYRPYLQARLVDDPHVLGTVLFREVGELGFDRSYQTFTRELRALGLRPVCECCRRGGVDVTIEIDHPPGEELQFDWLELRETPWGQPAFVLIGALSHSGRCRGVFCEGQSGPHVIESLDGVLRRLGGTTRRWRTDRMAGVVHPGTDRLLPEFAACAKHYGVGVDVCPARRAKRKGVAEAAVKYLTRSWWCSAALATPAQAQMSLDVSALMLPMSVGAALARSRSSLPASGCWGCPVRRSRRRSAWSAEYPVRRWWRLRATITASPLRWRAPHRSPSVPASVSRRYGSSVLRAR